MLEDAINKDYVQAMKARDSVKSGTLNFLRAQLKNVRIEKRVEKIEDADVIAVIKKQIKQRQDSIEQFNKGGRADLVEKEQVELDILVKYLPAQMLEDDLKMVVGEVIKESGASSMKDMGKVMKLVIDKVGGAADNKMVSQLVKAAISAM